MQQYPRQSQILVLFARLDQPSPSIHCGSAEIGGIWRSETTTTATTLSASRVGRSGGDVLDTADLHAGTGEGTESRLGTGAGGLGAVT